VAAAMAEGVRRISGADIGISTTGVAGPGGGSEAKPVGLMYTGFATADGVSTKRLHFVEDRIINKNRMSQTVLDILRLHLQRDY
jgi:nicotinamide-nucleotide amidase